MPGLRLRSRWSDFQQRHRKLDRLDELDLIRQALGRIEMRQLQPARDDLPGWEFRVYSQGGEDGIIQSLIRRIAIPRKVFVEFGVEDYREANTRFLAINDGWAGLIMDSSAEHVATIRNHPDYWRMNVKVAQAFVTRENINALLAEQGVAGDIGLLSIDIDGNDYWVWEALEGVRPAIAVVEYNYRFGPERAVVVPYDPNFDRAAAHPSRLYFGASIKALCLLGARKGYSFVGCNHFGVNAFFVRSDLLPAGLPSVNAAEGWVEGPFREGLGTDGRPGAIDHDEEKRILDGLPLVEIQD